MKIAVIGAGNWGKNLVKNLHDLNALSSIVDTALESEERAKVVVTVKVTMHSDELR